MSRVGGRIILGLRHPHLFTLRFVKKSVWFFHRMPISRIHHQASPYQEDTLIDPAKSAIVSMALVTPRTADRALE